MADRNELLALAEKVEIARDDLLYLVRLAEWAAGQGFCEIEGLEDPDEWCFRKWEEMRPDDNGDGYSADALACAIASEVDHG